MPTVLIGPLLGLAALVLGALALLALAFAAGVAFAAAFAFAVGRGFAGGPRGRGPVGNKRGRTVVALVAVGTARAVLLLAGALAKAGRRCLVRPRGGPPPYPPPPPGGPVPSWSDLNTIAAA